MNSFCTACTSLDMMNSEHIHGSVVNSYSLKRVPSDKNRLDPRGRYVTLLFGVKCKVESEAESEVGCEVESKPESKVESKV